MDAVKKEYVPKAEELCAQLLATLLSAVKEDGSIGKGDEYVLTHHLLLVLNTWKHPVFSRVVDRAVEWFDNLPDYREMRETQFNPFKLYAFTHLDRPDTRDYVANKIQVLRKTQVKSHGYAVLQLGFMLAGDIQEVFPTLMAADLLLTEGSRESVEVAKKTIDWSYKEICSHTVYENLSSILGFAALVGTKYLQKTGDPQYQEQVNEFIDTLHKAQEAGIWEKSKYQSSYIFYDVAYIWSTTQDPRSREILDRFMNVLFSESFFDEQVLGQNGVIVISSLLRGLGIMLSTQQQERISQEVVDHALQAASILRRREMELQYREALVTKVFKDFQENRVIPVNPSIFTGREFVVDPRQVFVLMPYGEKTWFYKDPTLGDLLQKTEYDFDLPFQKLITPAIQELNLTCIRADSIFDPGRHIMEKIWIEINESALIIADVTSSNPNVLYELGIAHTLGKPLIILTQKDMYVPTDLKSIEYVRYKPDLGREEELKTKLKNAIVQTLKLPNET